MIHRINRIGLFNSHEHTMHFDVLIKIIGGAGTVVAIGNEKPIVLSYKDDGDERNLLHDLQELGADVLVGFRQKLRMRGAEHILRFEFLDLFPMLFELLDGVGNYFRIKDEIQVFHRGGDVLFGNFICPFYFLHDFLLKRKDNTKRGNGYDDPQGNTGDERTRSNFFYCGTGKPGSDKKKRQR
jgi:hypothetical protein